MFDVCSDRQLLASEASSLGFECLLDLLPDDEAPFIYPVSRQLDLREPLSYASLRCFGETLAAELRALGLCAGARVASALPNVPELAVAFLSITALNLTFAPLNPVRLAQPRCIYPCVYT